MSNEDPFLQHTRIEAANAMANSIVDTINEHATIHGTHDPALNNMVLAALATVAESAQEHLDKNFKSTLAKLLLWDQEEKL